ncbi:MAG: hypothetical protein JRJ59_01630 [Deltaproteobacteria bacterium]|nr:hypothetical protein [Deltaproteobacteria bacterium]
MVKEMARQKTDQASDKPPANWLLRLAGLLWWLALAAGLGGNPLGPGPRLFLWLAGLGLLAILFAAWGKLRRLVFEGRLGWLTALAAGAAWGATWAWLNMGLRPLGLIAIGLFFAALALMGRGLVARFFEVKGQDQGVALARASALCSLGFLVVPALFLTDPSRHLASLVLALCLFASLAAASRGLRLGQVALILVSLSFLVYLLELSGTIALGIDADEKQVVAAARPAANEMDWRRAKLETARAEQEAHWFERCYQGRAISINSYGFRGREFSAHKPDNVFRVLVSGASVAFGTTASGDALTLQGQLESRLNDLFEAAGTGLKAEVYNLALPALTSAAEVSVLLNLMESKPDLVIMFTGWNDLVFAHEPGYFAPGQMGLLVPGCTARTSRNRVRGEVDQTAFGARHTATISRALKQLVILVHERIADSSKGYAWLTSLGQDPEPAPDRAGPEKLPDEGGLGRPGQDQVGVERLLANARRAQALAQAQGAGLLLAIQPFRHCGPVEMEKPQKTRMTAIRRSYQVLLARLAGQDELKWVDTTPQGDLMEAMGSFYDTCHFDDEGFALASEAVWRALLDKNLIPPLAEVRWRPLEPVPGQEGLKPWALTIGSQAEATLEVPAGQAVKFKLEDGLEPGRVLLWTALGGPPWVRLDSAAEVPYQVLLRQADGQERPLAQGVYSLPGPRAQAWQPVRLEIEAADLAGGQIVLIAGQAGTGPFDRLHWRWPSLVVLPAND